MFSVGWQAVEMTTSGTDSRPVPGCKDPLCHPGSCSHCGLCCLWRGRLEGARRPDRQREGGARTGTAVTARRGLGQGSGPRGGTREHLPCCGDVPTPTAPPPLLSTGTLCPHQEAACLRVLAPGANSRTFPLPVWLQRGLSVLPQQEPRATEAQGCSQGAGPRGLATQSHSWTLGLSCGPSG